MRKWHLIALAVMTLAISVTLLLASKPDLDSAISSSSRNAGTTRSAQLTPPPSDRRWDPGLDHTYALELVTEIEQAGHAVTLGVRGTWQTTVIADGDDHAMLRVQLANPEATANGESAVALVDQLATPWFVELDGDGAIEAAWFEPTVARAARDQLETIAAYLQYCPPNKSPCHRTEQDAMGTYESEYAATNPTELTRTKLRYVTIASARGQVAPETLGGPNVQTSTSQFSLDADGWPTSAQVAEKLVVLVEQLHQQFSGAVTLRLDHGAITTRTDLVGSFADARARLRRFAPLAEGPDAANTADSLDRHELGTADYKSLIAELAATTDEHAQAAIQRRLRALFSVHPSDAQRAAAMLRDSRVPVPQKQVVIAALAASGTPEAQRTLVAYLPDADPDLRLQTLGSVGVTPTPTADTINAIKTLATTTTNDADKSTAMLALGNLAHGDDDTVAYLIDQLHAATSDDQVILCLQALANTGDPRALPPIVEQLKASDVDVRAVAVSSLRLFADPSVDGLIAQMLLGDVDDHVRGQAVFADGFRAIDRALPSLNIALRRDVAISVRLAIVRVLAGQRVMNPQCDPPLAWAAQHDADETVRQAAAEALASSRS